MSTKKEQTFNNVLKYILLLFAVALMVLLIYIIVFKESDLFDKLLGSGISLTGIVGVVQIAIFKHELDTATTTKEKQNIMKILIDVFKIMKNKKNE